MKKSIIIVLFAALLLGNVSCTDLLDPSLRNAGQVIPEGATLTIGFGVPAEVSTKAATMASDPTIESIHVFVFDEEGTLLQIRKAEVGDSVTANYDGENVTSAMTSSWYVDNILMSNEKRVLHFVANLADDQIPTSGSETSIFQSLAVTKPNASYWQRIELNNILPYKYKGEGKYSYVDDDGVFQKDKPVKTKTGTSVDDSDGSYTDINNFPVNVGDYIDRESRKIVNGTGYYADETVSAKLALVPLVRNFARIEFTNSWSSFTLKKIALAYEPNAGLVAPFNGNFASEYVNLTAGQKPDMNSSTYTPLLPAAGVNENCPTEFIPVGDDQKATLFIYERGIPTDKATCVLIGGILTGATDAEKDGEGNTWFKIEVADNQGAYFKIYRDCTYLMNVTSIDATATKYPSAESAHDAAPIGDLSNSPETATLTQITDGNGLTLWVNYIDHVDMTGNREYPLLYTFFYENGSTKKYFCEGDKDRVTFSREPTPGITLGWATTESITKKGVISNNSNSDYMNLRPDYNYTWYLAMVKLNPKDDNHNLKSDIVVKGEGKAVDGAPRNMTLTRRVTYTVMPRQGLGLEASPIDADAAGNPTVLTITLPNTLGPSVFPLTLKIEAEDNNLTPSDNLTVETGPSSFDSKGNTYYFLKTISYTEYQALASASYQVTCAFQTTKATGKTPVTKIRVTEKLQEDADRESLFKEGDDATVELTVSPFRLSRYETSVAANEISATFSITSTGDENPTWTLTPVGNITSLSAVPALSTGYSGSGNATVTVNFPQNTNTTQTETYTVIAKRNGFPDREFNITQRPKPMTFPASQFSGSNNTYSSSNDYVSITLEQAQKSGTGTNTYLTLGRRPYYTTYRGSITITPKTGFKITGIQVTYTDGNNAGYDFNDDDTSVSVNTGSYTRDGSTSNTATWTGSSTGDVIFTNGYTTSGWLTTTYNFPQIASIEVTLENI